MGVVGAEGVTGVFDLALKLKPLALLPIAVAVTDAREAVASGIGALMRLLPPAAGPVDEFKLNDEYELFL